MNVTLVLMSVSLSMCLSLMEMRGIKPHLPSWIFTTLEPTQLMPIQSKALGIQHWILSLTWHHLSLAPSSPYAMAEGYVCARR